MRLCIIQVIDRIACTQLGSSREETVEDQKFIIPKEGQKIIKMPKSGKRFPDLSGGSSLRPATVQVPVAVGFDSLVDTDSELEQIDIDEEVELDPEHQKSPPTKARTRKKESRSKPPDVWQQPNKKKILSFAALGGSPPAADTFIGTMSIPANEEPGKMTQK
jgi:hypothetical protein